MIIIVLVVYFRFMKLIYLICLGIYNSVVYKILFVFVFVWLNVLLRIVLCYD